MNLEKEEDLPALLAHDLQANFPKMYECFYHRLSLYALRVLKCHPDEVEDLVQETFRKAFRAMASYSAEEVERIHLWSWLRQILANSFVDLQRKRKIIPISWDTKVSETLEDVIFEQPEEVAEQNEFRQRVHELLESLKPEYREPVKLRHIYGLSFAEIAEKLQIPIETVRNRMAYGKRLLRDRVLNDAECSRTPLKTIQYKSTSCPHNQSYDGRDSTLRNIDQGRAALTPSVDMKEQRDMENHEHVEPPSASPSLEHEPQTDSYAAMAVFIDKRPEYYQVPLRLHCLEKKSYAEIAHQLCLSEGTVKSQISRGQKKLQKLLAQTETDSENAFPQTLGIFSEEQVANLPEIYQAPVRLHYLEKKTYTEIAYQLNIPKGTVKSYVSRGCKLLAQQQ